MLYLSEDLLIANSKKELECLQKDLNLCGNVTNLNGVWSFKLWGYNQKYRVSKRQDVTCITSCDLPDVIDLLKTPYIICEGT